MSSDKPFTATSRALVKRLGPKGFGGVVVAVAVAFVVMGILSGSARRFQGSVEGLVILFFFDLLSAYIVIVLLAWAFFGSRLTESKHR